MDCPVGVSTGYFVVMGLALAGLLVVGFKVLRWFFR